MVCLGLFSDEHSSDATYEYPRQQEIVTKNTYTTSGKRRGSLILCVLRTGLYECAWLVDKEHINITVTDIRQ